MGFSASEKFIFEHSSLLLFIPPATVIVFLTYIEDRQLVKFYNSDNPT